jgi:hypothetical protein
VWDADTFEIKALLKKDGKPAGVLDMNYAGSPSNFEGFWNINMPGSYEAVVYAYDPLNGNTGLDTLTFSVE